MRIAIVVPLVTLPVLVGAQLEHGYMIGRTEDRNALALDLLDRLHQTLFQP